MTSKDVLFVPGLNCTADVFAHQVAALSPKVRCLVADHSGGETIEDIARSILTEAPDTFALVGFSLGGYIAFEMVRQAPERVERLALLDTQAAPDVPARRGERLDLVSLVRSGRYLEAEQEHWAKVVHPSRLDDRDLRALKMQMARELGPELWLRHTAAIMDRPDSGPTLATISMPTLILVGDSDQLTTPERAREMADGIPESRLVVIHDCGHMAPIEHPDAVNAALLDWLSW